MGDRNKNYQGHSNPRNRWGPNAQGRGSGPSGPGRYDRRDQHRPYPSSQSRPAPTRNNDDNEALQALLQSAEARQSEQNKPIGQSRKDRPAAHSNNPRRQDRPGEQRGLPSDDSYYGPSSGSRQPNREERDRSSRPSRVEDEDDDGTAKNTEGDTGEDTKPEPTHKPNFGLSGALDGESGGGTGGIYKGIKLKFQEPPEARAPNTQWRFYVFKGKELLETLHISKQSAYLMGRNTEICDIPMAHPSLSSQHAVLQYRALPHKETGRVACQPYIMDLESTNGTKLNGIPIDGARYYQLKKGDVLTFGGSTREYVLLTQNSTSIR